MESNRLPTQREQFFKEYFEPIRMDPVTIHLSIPSAFDLAQEHYERDHEHRLPFSEKSFMSYVYANLKELREMK